MLSFATEKKNQETLHIISQENEDDAAKKEGVTLSIDKVGLSANNKFYMQFGENPSFKFFQCYPINDKAKILPSDLETEESSRSN